MFLISAEAIASDIGLGYRIFLVRRYLSMDIILPYVAWIALLATAMDLLLAWSSRRLFPWAHGAAPLSALLSLRDVWVEYGDKIVLERLNLDIEAGSFVSIIGPSGAGKSSLLRLILGQEVPTRGSILLDGTPLRQSAGPDRGVVFQRYSVFPHLSVLRNTLFGLECAQAPFTARLFGARRRAAAAEAEEMLEAVGLGRQPAIFIRRKCPAACSSGSPSRRR